MFSVIMLSVYPAFNVYWHCELACIHADLWPHQAVSQWDQKTCVHYWDYGRLLWLPGQCGRSGCRSRCRLYLRGAIWHQRPAGDTSVKIHFVVEPFSPWLAWMWLHPLEGIQAKLLYITMPSTGQHYIYCLFPQANVEHLTEKMKGSIQRGLVLR